MIFADQKSIYGKSKSNRWYHYITLLLQDADI